MNQVYIGLLYHSRKLRIKWYGTTSHPKLILTTFFFFFFGYFHSSVFHRGTTDTNFMFFCWIGWSAPSFTMLEILDLWCILCIKGVARLWIWVSQDVFLLFFPQVKDFSWFMFSNFEVYCPWALFVFFFFLGFEPFYFIFWIFDIPFREVECPFLW